MFRRGAQGTTYGVFVRFRRSKLRLRRGIVDLAEALAIADALRAERLHGQDEVFVAREGDGAVMTRADATLPTAPAVPAAPAAPPAGARARAAHPSVEVEQGLRAAIVRAQRAEERALEAQRRHEAISSAIAAAITRGSAPIELAQSHERTSAVRDLYARAIASFAAARSVTEAGIRRASDEREAPGGAAPPV